MTIKTFKRYEKKYLLSKEQYDLLIPRLLEYMNLDEHCVGGSNYQIYNIYYDTDHDDVIRHSVSKPYYKEKLRLRSYYIPKDPNDKVFLEIKKKIGGIVSKRRITLTLQEANELLSKGIRPQKESFIDNQVLNEIEYYLKVNDVHPNVYVGYSRKAFFAKDNHDFRLTFDSIITTRRYNLTLEDGFYGTQLLKNNEYLMEVKILGSIPLWLTEILSELKIYNTHFSKYGNEFIEHCKQEVKNNQGIGGRKIC